MLSIRMIIRIRIYATWSLAPTDLYWDAVVCTPVTPPLGSCGATESFPSSPAQKCNFVLHEDDLWFVQGCVFFGWPQMQIDESWNSDQVSIVQTTSKAAPSVVPHRAIVLEEQNYTTPPLQLLPPLSLHMPLVWERSLGIGCVRKLSTVRHNDTSTNGTCACQQCPIQSVLCSNNASAASTWITAAIFAGS